MCVSVSVSVGVGVSVGVSVRESTHQCECEYECVCVGAHLGGAHHHGHRLLSLQGWLQLLPQPSELLQCLGPTRNTYHPTTQVSGWW